MQHFRGTQAIEDLDAKMGGPTLSDIRGERLAGGSAATHPEFVLLREVRARQQGGEECRYAVKNRRLVLLEPREDSCWRRTLAHQHGGSPYRKWKRESVAEAIGEKELRSREDDIVLANAEDGPGVELGRGNQARMHVHGAFGRAGRDRRI